MSVTENKSDIIFSAVTNHNKMNKTQAKKKDVKCNSILRKMVGSDIQPVQLVLNGLKPVETPVQYVKQNSLVIPSLSARVVYERPRPAARLQLLNHSRKIIAPFTN